MQRRYVPVAALMIVATCGPGAVWQTRAGELQLVEIYKLQIDNDMENGMAYSVAFSPDGKRGLLGTNNAATGMILFDAILGREIRRFPSTSSRDIHLFLDYSPDGQYGAVGCLNGEVRVFSLSGGERVHTLVHGGVPSSVKFSPDARRIASVGTDGSLCIWDLASGTELSRMQANQVPIANVCWAPDGRHVAAGGWDRMLRIWDVATQTVVRSTEHPDAVWAIDYSPDGRLLASITGGVFEGVSTREVYAPSTDYKIRLWDTATGELNKELVGMKHTSRDLAFSPDGKLLAVGGIDKAIHVFDVASGEEVAHLDCETWCIGIAWSPDGKMLAAAGGFKQGTEDLLVFPPERLRVFRLEKRAE